MQKKQIAIYNGPGADIQDMEKSLKILKISYRKLGKKEIREKLNKFKILIISGGTTEKYVSSLSKKNFYQIIKEFIFKGGKYIGICGGAYLAPKECICLKRGRRIKLKGLGIINIQCIREHTRRRPGKLRKIKLKKHSLTKNCPGELDIWWRNGPLIISRKGVEVVAFYENGLGAIVYSKYGKGKVIIFSPHPEGDFKEKINPEKLGTLNLLGNAIDY